ncbi:MAG: CRISPR-associated endonuclease Cas2 [Dehalococcoidia bacterium]
MEFLVAYDVSTESLEGQRRLRRVAKICEGHGQRVQKSVFECSLTEMQLEQLRHQLLHVIKTSEDSLRIYRLREPRRRYMEVLGVQPWFDIHDPLVV